MTRIASHKYTEGARGESCKLRIAGVCTGGGEDTVFAHIRDRHTGRAIKASDISGADACRACHAKFDGQAGKPLSAEDWFHYALRGIQETLENRIERGLLFVTQDVHREPKPRQRKSPEQRRKVPAGKPMESRSSFPPAGTRKIARPLRKETVT